MPTSLTVATTPTISNPQENILDAPQFVSAENIVVGGGDVVSPDLCLQDASIVIRTLSHGTPPRRTLYKVHKHVLALHCSVFESMFTGPQAAFDVGSDRHDGLPVMDLPDNPDDVLHFLKALYFPKETHHVPVAEIPGVTAPAHFPPSYHGILRLAMKYGAQDVQDIVVLALKTQGPSTLGGYDTLLSDVKKRYVYPSDSGQIISLARLCSIPDVLPLAFHLLSIRVRNASPARDPHINGLNSEDLCRLISGQNRSSKMMQAGIKSFVLSTCQARLCHVEMRTWLDKNLLDIMEGEPLWYLRNLRARAREAGAKKVFCDPCTANLRSQIDALRQSIWMKLPESFGLQKDVSAKWGSVEAST
ncbi:hypothetical protein FA95DRAFT_1604969 [Auriscalpium vulgare]|uniref:Uncharacterized protein n=1 Tax=Auriscalpium vulgare TaxID=40419 RepID=A0ACB8RY31_9AGAM|nr:hypothetical protein FA95DRAFT_1604969 [Auriscalpium vulgare]